MENQSIKYPQKIPTNKDIKCTAITGAKKDESVIAAPINTKAASPNVEIKVATTVPYVT